MSRAMMQRLDARHFPHYHAHDVFDGGHAAPLQHFDRVEAFLRDHFLAGGAAGCARGQGAPGSDSPGR
jgi:hypothetical protein